VSQADGDFEAILDKAHERYRGYHAENEPERLGEAIAFGQRALALATTPEQRSQALSIQATALQDRYWRTMSLADLDESIRLFEESAGYAPEGKSHLLTVYGLGLSLLARFTLTTGLGDPAAARRDLARAIDRLEFSVRLIEFNRLDRMKLAGTLDDLGSAYREQYKLSGRKRDYRQAVKCQERALKLLPPLRTLSFAYIPGLEVATALCTRHLGETFLAHFSRSRDADSLGKALNAFRSSLGLVADPLTFECAAAAWTESFKLSPDPRRLENAEQCLRYSVQRGLDVAPLVALRASRALMAGLLDGTFAAAEDSDALDQAFEAAQSGSKAMRLVVSQAGRTFEVDARRQIAGFGAEAAFVYSRRGLVREALAVAEATAASMAGEAQRKLNNELVQLTREGHGELARSYRVSADSLLAAGPAGRKLGEGDGGQRPPPGQEAPALGNVIAQIRALPGHQQFGGSSDPVALHESMGKNENWLYLLGSPWGTVSLVIRDDGTQGCCVLSELTREHVNELRQGLSRLDAPNVSQRSRNSTALEAMDRLADALWDPLYSRLGLGSGTLTVFPGGNFAALPLEPARLIDRTRRPRPDQSAQFFPSATLLARSSPGRSVKIKTALVICDPELPGSREDLAIVQRFFGNQNVTSYVAAEAGPRDLLAEIESASLIHCASHGQANLVDPQMSSFKLGPDRVLTVGRLWDASLGHARLAVIGTCQSATVGGSLADELMTFPTVFLRAGTGSVLATLWSVGDRATSRLLESFYSELAREGADPASALRECQTRLMTAPAPDIGPADWAAFVCYG